ncbi:interferon-induced very large GTPase 1-like [Hyperolius riggenbachi]|uniref:interferon-induced very large GTPase 1-like n=1 Tax=Hyperolius riggenbachi TaxID=752182 RepID=UPI0035A39789
MSDNKPDDEYPSNNELVKKIKESGLDPKLWLPIIEEELGIKNVQSLENIQPEDFAKIEKQIQHPWEKRALRKLFNLCDCSEDIAEVQTKRNLLMKGKNKQAFNKLEHPEALHLKGKTQQDEDVQQHEREMWKAQEIHPICLQPQEKPNGDLIEYLEKDVILKNESFSKRENLTYAGVICYASEGLALEGIFQTKNMEDEVVKREPVLCIPSDIRLAGPEQSSVVQQEEFLSPTEECDFQKTAKNQGLNLHGLVFDHFLVPGLKGSSAHSNSSECEHACQHNYVCATRYNYIPLASCYLRRDQLRLSQSALSALKDIDKAIFVHANEENLARKCTDFFHRFGSHVNSGPIHFGGLFWMKVSMKVDDFNQIKKAKKATSDALHHYMGTSCAAFREDSDFLLTAPESVDFSKTSKFQEDIQVSIAKTEGPSKAASFLQWKSGLVTSNKTWSVIHRGSQLVPIWTVIKDNHKSNFIDNSKLASCLSKQYNIYGTKVHNISSLLKELDLEKYYPQKMKIMDARKICLSYLAEKHDFEETQLPLLYLQKLLMLDYNAKYVQCAQSSHLTAQADGGENVIDIFPHSNIQKYEQQNEQAIHPMDVQMSVFHCADDFMRQYLYSKLSNCQFALPLLVPQPNSDSIEFPLWSFQEIKKNLKKKCKCGTPYDKFIKKEKTHIVSFLRLGQSSSSKSQLMNWLISKQKHDIFFHRHCRGSTNNALLMNGVTEIAWYFPGGKEDDQFDDCIAFTNLHGDAQKHNRQVKFLEKISSVIVVVFSELDMRGKEMLQQLQKSPKSLICLLADKEKCQIGKGNTVNICLKNRNEAEMIQDISQTIQSLLSNSKKEYSLETCADIARKHGFVVDEDKTQCKQGKEDAQGLLSLLKAKDVSIWKEAFLPLQGELWCEWCEKDKEMARLKQKSNASIRQHQSNILSEKSAIRDKQLKRASPLNDFLKHFLGSLRKANQGLNMHFLHWLKMYLDDLSSKSLSMLQENYHKKWTQIKEEQEKKANKVIIESLKYDLEKLSKEIERSRFGLEHILRELGQIYEASETFPGNENDYFTLPKIAAHLMVSGYPIELMDGETAHVPLKWIGAILDELVERLGDKKLYVLTVLGIQSTGKSTLLNAMFGLQFAVSAGRGTRGAFMQLIKVDEQLRKELNFDYILVVDTEGLRAVDLSMKTTINHDNELATFVIGLSNISLINVFGENPSEMQDILQIAVQAFLRMKKFNLRPSCVFVHQNGGEITAKEKNLEGRRLQEKLNELALCAAQQERCDITCFNDVIRFDVNAHIHYFDQLWKGDPPMAPPNPCYSQNVQKLRQVILDSGKQEEMQNCLCISTFKARLNDLWNALLNENFVFSFKNSPEIAIYNKLEAKYSQWAWTLRKCMLTIQNQIINQIHNNEFMEENIKLLGEQFEPSYKEILRNFEGVFDDEKDKEILIQWSENTRTRLVRVRNDLIEEVKKKADQMIKYKKINGKVNNFMEKFEDEVLMEITDLALSMKGKDIPEEELKQRFDERWKSLIIKVQKETNILIFEKPTIYTDLEDVFLEGFKKEANIIDTIKESYIWKNLVDEFSKYIFKKPKLSMFCECLSKDDKKTIQRTTQILEGKLDEFLKQKEWEKMDYQSVYFHEILNMLQSEIRNKLEKFTFRRDYTLIASLFLCHKAAKRFDKMSKDFRKANDPVVHLSNRKDEFWQIIRIVYQGNICSKLKEAIQEGVYEKSAIDFAGNMRSQRRALNGNKEELDLYLLISLAEKEEFFNYLEYIQKPQSAVSDFIEKCVEQYFDGNTKVSEILNLNLEDIRNIILNAIDTTATLVGRNDSISKWLKTFCSQLGSEVKLSRNDLISKKYQNITDMEFLKKAMTQALKISVKQLKKSIFCCDLTNLQKKVREIFSEQFCCGCFAQCPFCGAVCTNSIPKHAGDHSATFHRPQALIGWRYGNSKLFVVEDCSAQVAGDGNFELKDGTCIPYEKYRKAGPPYNTWSITPDDSPLHYWKWVTCHFQKELEQHYEFTFTERGKMPPQWHSITKKDAIDEIKKYLARNRK